jgi:hypothetical protein
MTDEPEVPLTGGDMTAVVRVGDTVRRAAGPWTPAVHALLRHLRAEGFTQVPEPRGLDEHGREVLSFLTGEAVTYPLPPFVLTDATLTAVARLMRAYHAAASTFAIPDGAVWQWPAHEPQELVCHNDIAPYNLVFDRTAIVGVIDWDLASPGPRRWDLAEAAYRFVPLTGPDNPDVDCPGVAEQARRLALFCAEYGDVAPADVLGAAIAKERELVEWIVACAAAGDPAQQAVLERGDVAIYEHDIAHLETHRDALA